MELETTKVVRRFVSIIWKMGLTREYEDGIAPGAVILYRKLDDYWTRRMYAKKLSQP
jgi:hypothetical protein